MRRLIAGWAVGAVLGGAVAGCARDTRLAAPQPAGSSTRPSETQGSKPSESQDTLSRGSPARQDIVYVECPQQEAETTLVVEVTIAGFAFASRHVFPLRKETLDVTLNSGGAWHECYDEFSPRAYFGGSVSLVRKPADGVPLRVSFYWGGAKIEKGQVDEELVIPLGKTSVRKLSDKVTIRAFYR